MDGACLAIRAITSAGRGQELIERAVRRAMIYRLSGWCEVEFSSGKNAQNRLKRRSSRSSSALARIPSGQNWRGASWQ